MYLALYPRVHIEMKKIIVLVFLTALLYNVNFLLAQERDTLGNNDRTFTLGEVVVFGAKTTDSANSVTYKKIERFKR